MCDKRFELYGNNYLALDDNVEEKTYYLNDDESIVLLVAKMNELVEKNKQLQKQVKSLETTMNATSDYNAYLQSEVKDLEKENKQLQKKIIEQQDFVNLLFDELLDAQRQGYVVNFIHKNRPCSILSKEDLDE